MTCLLTCPASSRGDCSIPAMNSCVLARVRWHVRQHTCWRLFYRFSEYGVLANVVGVIGDDASQF
jgi:hypothetical protein